jgi:hypothetical protein
MAMAKCCIDCTKRYVGCHSKCEDYLKFRRELDEKNEARIKAKQEEDRYISYCVDVNRRVKRKRNKR